MTSAVLFTSYNPEWPSLFEMESHRLKSILSQNFLEIHHIGSTSVPGLSAKPIIDILVVVKDILQIGADDLAIVGYEGRGEMGMPFRRYFSNKNIIFMSGNRGPMKFKNSFCSEIIYEPIQMNALHIRR